MDLQGLWLVAHPDIQEDKPYSKIGDSQMTKEQFFDEIRVTTFRSSDPKTRLYAITLTHEPSGLTNQLQVERPPNQGDEYWEADKIRALTRQKEALLKAWFQAKEAGLVRRLDKAPTMNEFTHKIEQKPEEERSDIEKAFMELLESHRRHARLLRKLDNAAIERLLPKPEYTLSLDRDDEKAR